jgi:hypothetical protein
VGGMNAEVAMLAQDCKGGGVVIPSLLPRRLCAFGAGTSAPGRSTFWRTCTPNFGCGSL